MIQATNRWLRRYSHINWALADQVMVSGVNFLTGFLLARYLGIQEYGRFTLAWMAVQFVNSLQMAMIITPMMSIGSKQTEEEAPAYYAAVLTQQLAFAGLSFLLLLLGIKASTLFFPQWQMQHLAFPLAFAASAYQIQDFLRRYFFTRGIPSAAFAIDTASYLGQLGLLILLFKTTKLNSNDVLWVISGTSAVAAGLGVFGLGQIEFNCNNVRSVINRHWHFAKWMTGSALMQWASGNIFIVGAGTILGASAVGAMKASQNIIGVTHILFQAFENIVPAQAGRHFRNGGVKALVTYLSKVAKVGGLVTGSIALLVAALPQLWLVSLYGPDYKDYGFVLQWYAAIYLLVFLCLPMYAGLRAQEHTQPVFWSYATAAIFSLALFIPIINTFGLTGVMAGIFSSYLILVINLTFSLRYISKRLNY